MNYIYILYNCDEWKTAVSMFLLTASTSAEKIKDIITIKIKHGDMEYKRGQGDLPKVDQIMMLHRDWKTEGQEFVFNNLEYGYVEIVTDGEIQ